MLLDHLFLLKCAIELAKEPNSLNFLTFIQKHIWGLQEVIISANIHCSQSLRLTT
jgi:hypothetical protein